MPVRTLLQSLPKVQLHCHLEGSIHPETFFALARKHNIDLGARAALSMEEAYAFSDFLEFLQLFKAVSETLRTPEDFSQITRDYIVDAASQNVRYAEIFISPSVWTYFQPDLDVRAAVTAIRQTLDAQSPAHGMEVFLIADLTRNFGLHKARQTAELAVSLKDLGVIGIGLGGDEARWPSALFEDAFAYARSEGMHCVAHAGEAAGPQSVREALDILRVERIGHGVRALEDPQLVQNLAERRIPLELCPTSNRLTGVVPLHARHPIAEFHEQGVVCTIDADDPALFGTTLTDEYLHVTELLGIEATLQIAGNAIDASFASQARKAALHRELKLAGNLLGADTLPLRRTS